MPLFTEKLRRGRFLPVVAVVTVAAVITSLCVRALLESGQQQSEPRTGVDATTGSEIRPDELSPTPVSSSVSSNDAGDASSASPPADDAVASDESGPFDPEAETVPIPVPGRLVPWFEDDEARSSAHAQLEAERREPVWATFNETMLANFLRDNLDSQNFELLSLECRSQTCEVLLTGYGQLIDGGPRHTAADAFVSTVLPLLPETAWFNFTDADVSYEVIDSGAVGIHFILHENPQATAANDLPVDGSADSSTENSVQDSVEDGQSGNALVGAIPVADELAPLLQQNAEWAEFHQRLEREPENLSWSIFMEDQIAEFFASRPDLAGHELLLAECRTRSCEVQLTVPYNAPGPWQFELLAIDQQPWFEFDSWQMNGGTNPQDSMTLILQLDGGP